jgi:hypothetical protein
VRALALSRVPGLDVRTIHLVRDSRGVAWSLARAHAEDPRAGVERPLPARPVWRSAAFWVAVNLQAEWLRQLVPPDRWLRVRYESLVTDLPGLAPALGRLAGADLDAVLGAAARGDALPIGHLIAGGRVRMSGSLRLHLDEAWRERLPARDRRLVWALSGWLARRYGYAA